MVRFFDSIDKAIQAVSTKHGFIIGGTQIFEQTMSTIDGIYMTRIYANFEGDTFYPEIPPYFKEKSREKLQEKPLIEVISYENVEKR